MIAFFPLFPFLPLFLSPSSPPCRLRDLKPDQWVGKLASVSGTVTRTSEVRPELLYGTFQCMECGKIARDVEQQFKYTQVGE